MPFLPLSNNGAMFSNIVWISGMPRSGTTWFSQILASHPDVRLKFCPLFSYEFKNMLDENSTAGEWRNLLQKVYITEGEYLDQEHLRRYGHIPEFRVRNKDPSVLAIKSTRYHNLTTGLVRKCPEIKWIGLVRNPCAAIYSWLDNPLEFPQGADPQAEWRSGSCRKGNPGEFWGYDDWKAVTEMFLDLEDEHPGRFYLARYEEFVDSLSLKVRDMFEWLGLDMHEQTLEFLNLSQQKHVNHKRSVYKNPESANRWKIELSTDIRKIIETDLTGTRLAQFLDVTQP
jgi:hypothetical protein